MEDGTNINRWISDAFKNNTIATQIKDDLKYNLKIRPHPHFSRRSLPNQELNLL